MNRIHSKCASLPIISLGWDEGRSCPLLTEWGSEAWISCLGCLIQDSEDEWSLRSAISTFNVMGNHFYPIIIYEYCLWNGGWKLFQLWEMWEGFCLVFISAGDNNTKNFHNTIIFRWIFIFKLSPLINNIMSALLPNIRQRCMCAFCLLVYLHSKETLEFPNFVCYSTISLNFE